VGRLPSNRWRSCPTVILFLSFFCSVFCSDFSDRDFSDRDFNASGFRGISFLDF
jgi:hypothetical protein